MTERFILSQFDAPAGSYRRMVPVTHPNDGLQGAVAVQDWEQGLGSFASFVADGHAEPSDSLRRREVISAINRHPSSAFAARSSLTTTNHRVPAFRPYADAPPSIWQDNTVAFEPLNPSAHPRAARERALVDMISGQGVEDTQDGAAARLKYFEWVRIKAQEGRGMENLRHRLLSDPNVGEGIKSRVEGPAQQYDEPEWRFCDQRPSDLTTIWPFAEFRSNDYYTTADPLSYATGSAWKLPQWHRHMY